MRKFKLTLGMFALVAGAAVAFAFAPAKSQSVLLTGEYYTNTDGTPTGNPVDPSHTCKNQTSVKCSAIFQLDENGLPIAGTQTNVRTGPIQ